MRVSKACCRGQRRRSSGRPALRSSDSPRIARRRPSATHPESGGCGAHSVGRPRRGAVSSASSAERWNQPCGTMARPRRWKLAWSMPLAPMPHSPSPRERASRPDRLWHEPSKRRRRVAGSRRPGREASKGRANVGPAGWRSAATPYSCSIRGGDGRCLRGSETLRRAARRARDALRHAHGSGERRDHPLASAVWILEVERHTLGRAGCRRPAAQHWPGLRGASRSPCRRTARSAGALSSAARSAKLPVLRGRERTASGRTERRAGRAKAAGAGAARAARVRRRWSRRAQLLRDRPAGDDSSPRSTSAGAPAAGACRDLPPHGPVRMWQVLTQTRTTITRVRQTHRQPSQRSRRCRGDVHGQSRSRCAPSSSSLPRRRLKARSSVVARHSCASDLVQRGDRSTSTRARPIGVETDPLLCDGPPRVLP